MMSQFLTRLFVARLRGLVIKYSNDVGNSDVVKDIEALADEFP